MKPFLLKLASTPERSFSVRIDKTPDVNNIWHYHAELELIYVKKGSGTQFIGDDVRPFKAGNVILVGSNLPHYWQYAEQYFKDIDNQPLEVYVVHFNNIWGEDFLALPENRALQQIIDKAKRGIQIETASDERITSVIEAIAQGSDSRKIFNLMDALLLISESSDQQILASEGFNNQLVKSEMDRMQAIFNFTLNHYHSRVNLDDISEVAKMSRGAFCKFFKAKTGKTYSRFINEIRIGNACRLLIEGHLSVKEICYEVGFNNFVSFHLFFKNIKGKTPVQYQKAYLQ
ncbi:MULTISPECIES: AraC family transcriptional regulator [Sphingobacterium]|uniref:AraC family transcriptional regulator n=1 Tax=Sphingobacterium populi TaxID=1812824 RepID=A0ABW5UBE2_9SPHI|nr:AraC family transcriptional regulator [Sphingobacterium sp. CFCC 11742]